MIRAWLPKCITGAWPIRVACQDITKRFGQDTVLDRVTLACETGQRWGIVGCSGAGKTTLLRLIAGLETPTAGTIRLADEADGPSRLRIGMVFQDLGLWPHLSARRHIEYVLTGVRGGARRRAAEQLLEEVQLPSETWLRRPSQLSGGEAQRLALARALANEPALLLLDEPLAQIHFALRAELTELLLNAVGKRGATLVCVTHSWLDLPALCEFVAVLDAGRVVQTGTFEQLYRQPVSPEVCRLTGPCLAVPAELLGQGKLAMHGHDSDWSSTTDGDFVLVRPQQLQAVESSGRNCWTVQTCRPQWAGWMVQLAGPDNEPMTLSISRPLTPGDEIGLVLEGVYDALRLTDASARTQHSPSVE